MKRVKPTKPPIVTRSAWGAARGGGLRYSSPLREIYYRVTAHHDAAKAPEPTLAAEKAQMREHQRTHFGLGWADIGYHYVIGPSGRIYQGRPIDVQAAHVLDENSGNVGICVMGELHKHEPTPAQVRALIALYTHLVYTLDLPTHCLKGHKDYLPTACPGSLYDHLPLIRQEAEAILKGEADQPQTPAPSLFLGDDKIGEIMVLDGVSYAPVRKLAEACGLSVAWERTTKSVKLRRP